MPPQAVKDWLSYFETIADDIGVDVEISSGDIFHIHFNTEPQAVAKVRYSEYPDRKENHIWQRFDREADRLDTNENERVFSVQLDVKSSNEFNRRHDHFVLIKENILREDLSPNGDIHIGTDQPGRYDPPFNGLADNWNIIFEHATGETYEYDVSEALGPISEDYGGANQVGETVYKVLESYGEAREESNWTHPVLQTLKQDLPAAIEELIDGRSDELRIDHTKLVGNISNIPWVNIFDTRAASSAQQGLYVVYLFDDVAGKVYLTLNQGVKQLREDHGLKVARSVLTRRSEILRDNISLSEFDNGPIAFSDELVTNRNELFQPGTVCYCAYDLGSFPSSTTIAKDLINLLDEYHTLVDEGVYDELMAAFDTETETQRNPFDEEPTQYFWINSASEGWYHEGETAFYKRTTSSGSPRRNQEVYERLQPGDKILVYRNKPKGAIVGKAHVEAGLHEESVDGREGTVEGVTVAWDEPIDEVEMSQIEKSPEFKKTAIVDSNNPYVITELSEQQYEAVLRLAGEQGANHFWVTANPSLWDIEGSEKGTEIFYTATTEQGHTQNIYSAFEAARPGDHVLFYQSSPIQQVVAEGSIIEGLHTETPTGRAEPVEGVTIRYERSIHPVNWSTVESLPELEETTVLKNQAQGALYSLPMSAYDAIKTVSEASSDDPFLLRERVNELRAKLSPPEISIELPPNLYFESEKELLRQIQASLNSGKHIIFTGPPGTGKTKLAKHISAEAADEHSDIIDGYQFTTATAEWTTFDTIGGYVPNRTEEGDELVFQPRIFLECFRNDGAINNEWLIIDEINRADIDKAFGQLFSVLSGDSVKLPYERDSPIELVALNKSMAGTDKEDLEAIVSNPDIFPITPSWRLIATMNTYDKTSLYELSYAFMRRFNFIHVGVPPLTQEGTVRTSLLNPNAQDNYATAWLAADDSLREPLATSYKQLAVIWAKINKQRTIGPSIVHDIVGYLAASGPETLEEPGAALTDAVIALVFPQLEGMAPKDQRSLITSLTDTGVTTEDGSVDLTLEGDRLERKAEDFFDLPRKSDE